MGQFTTQLTLSKVEPRRKRKKSERIEAIAAAIGAELAPGARGRLVELVAEHGIAAGRKALGLAVHVAGLGKGRSPLAG